MGVVRTTPEIESEAIVINASLASDMRLLEGIFMPASDKTVKLMVDPAVKVDPTVTVTENSDPDESQRAAEMAPCGTVDTN